MQAEAGQVVTGLTLSTSAVQDTFLSLVCADDELLRSEFEAIINASWGKPPTPDPLWKPTQPPDQGLWHHRYGVAAAAPQARHPGVGGWARQRSPPQDTRPIHTIGLA